MFYLSVMSEDNSTDDAVLDIGSSADPEERIGELRDRVKEQQEIIESQRNALHEHEQQLSDLSDILLDLSARVADSGGAGVCMKSQCPGALLRMRQDNGDEVIKCSGCGEIVHNYE